MSCLHCALLRFSCEGHVGPSSSNLAPLDVTSHEASSESGAMRKSMHKISLHWMNSADRLTMKGCRKPLQCTACKESEMRKAGARLTWAGDASALGLTSQVPALLGSVFRKRATIISCTEAAHGDGTAVTCEMQNATQKTADRADQAAAAVIYVHL